jgi:hypothetical protein
MNTELSNTRLPLMSNQQCLTIFEQFEMIDKARLSLSLRAPSDDATLEEKNALYDKQKIKILNFVELLRRLPRQVDKS